MAIFRSPPALNHLSTRSHAKTAVLAGITIAILAHLGLSAAAEVSFMIRDPLYGDLEAKLTAVECDRPKGTPVVVLLGTSRAGTGFDAQRISGPVAAFNFGVPGGGPIIHQIYLRRLLAAGHRPNLLLLELLPTSVGDLKTGPPEAPLLNGARFVHSEIALLAEYGLPENRLREQWRETVNTPWLGLRYQLLGRVAPTALPWHRRHDEGRTSDAHGWHRLMEEAFNPEMLIDGAARTRREYADNLANLRPGGSAGLALRDTLVLARDHGIPVRLLLMPEASWFREMSPPEVAARFNGWVRDLVQEVGCPLTDARQWIPDSGFADGHHLLPGGAAAFTDRLTNEVIAPHLATTTGVKP
ncbi:MAG: hypothetical protein K8U57_21040 [Planctomycetes bacterium]|nr:hypothetical protein [Planctomycetota bacterium]